MIEKLVRKLLKLEGLYAAAKADDHKMIFYHLLKLAIRLLGKAEVLVAFESVGIDVVSIVKANFNKEYDEF